MSLKIGMICSDLPQAGKKPGGVSIVVHELANALTRANNYVRVYAHAANLKTLVMKSPIFLKSLSLELLPDV